MPVEPPAEVDLFPRPPTGPLDDLLTLQLALSNKSNISSLYNSINCADTLNSGGGSPASLASSWRLVMPLNSCLTARGTNKKILREIGFKEKKFRQKFVILISRKKKISFENS